MIDASAIDIQYDRIPPHDLAAESCALGSLVLSGDAPAVFGKIRKRLWSSAFYSADNQILFDSICRVADSGKVDAVTLAADLRRRGLYDEIGGREYLQKIIGTVPSWAHGEHYAAIVAQHGRRRAAIHAATQLIAKMYGPDDEEPEARIAASSLALRKLASTETELPIIPMPQAVDSFIKRLDDKTPLIIPTGLRELDAEYGGFPGVFAFGKYCVVGGRTSMGKSMFIKDRLFWQAKQGRRVGLIEVEEDEPKVTSNLVSNESGIENARLASGGNFGQEEYLEITAACERMRALNFWQCDVCKNLSEVITAIETLAIEHQCQVIGVDHLHLIGCPGERERMDRLTKVSWTLKQTFKELRVVGIVAAQLSRPDKTQAPKPPQLTDLRECGAIEEHADAVLLLHREDYYHRHDKHYNPTKTCQIGVAKNRNGPVGGAEVAVDMAHQRFMDKEIDV